MLKLFLYHISHVSNGNMEKSEFKKSLYENTYKFINFKKSTPTIESSESGESISNFYLILAKEADEKKKNQLEIPKIKQSESISSDKKEISRKSKRLSNNNDPNALFKAAQNGDLDFIKSYLKNGSDILIEDEFKWNLLMIAVASYSNDILSYILENVANSNILNLLISNQDSSGNSVKSLANKFKNTDALRIIENFELKQANDIKTSVSLSKNEQNVSMRFWCVQCKNEFNQSESEHFNSIVHQLNENESAGCSSNSYSNCCLRSDNKGYQLLVKSGWNESSGLGVNEQGVTNPVKGKLKLNRNGLGVPTVDNKNKKFERPLRNIKLKKNDSNKTTSLRSFKKSQQKSKVKEKILRRYFDS